MNLVAALWACGVAMFLRTEQAGALIQMPVFVVLFLAPVYVPLNLLSGWIHAVARINPATARARGRARAARRLAREGRACFRAARRGGLDHRRVGAAGARLRRARGVATRK